mmetsp:Transcript_22079/g.62715  ORF Transcript_22079/g.62715 Transcript_22079/m.62715 type:complete len:394 (+) Transcript_22079:539-1720(+)
MPTGSGVWWRQKPGMLLPAPAAAAATTRLARSGAWQGRSSGSFRATARARRQRCPWLAMYARSRLADCPAACRPTSRPRAPVRQTVRGCPCSRLARPARSCLWRAKVDGRRTWAMGTKASPAVKEKQRQSQRKTPLLRRQPSRRPLSRRPGGNGHGLGLLSRARFLRACKGSLPRRCSVGSVQQGMARPATRGMPPPTAPALAALWRRPPWHCARRWRTMWRRPGGHCRCAVRPLRPPSWWACSGLASLSGACPRTPGCASRGGLQEKALRGCWWRDAILGRLWWRIGRRSPQVQQAQAPCAQRGPAWQPPSAATPWSGAWRRRARRPATLGWRRPLTRLPPPAPGTSLSAARPRLSCGGCPWARWCSCACRQRCLAQRLRRLRCDLRAPGAA